MASSAARAAVTTGPSMLSQWAATGAGRAQVVTFGIAPQVLPAFAGISVFRWDINIRESTVLGLVGAGGIGLELQASVNVLAWPQVTMILSKGACSGQPWYPSPMPAMRPSAMTTSPARTTTSPLT